MEKLSYENIFLVLLVNCEKINVVLFSLNVLCNYA